MTDKELKEIREKISCPQFGDEHYGVWGALTFNQRRTIKRVLDYIEAQEEYINRLQAENERLQETIDEQDIEIARLYKVIERLEEPTSASAIAYMLDNAERSHNKWLEKQKEIKTEAYKEFAEKVKSHSRKMQSSDFSGEFWDKAVLVTDIDNLSKELVGE